MAGDELMKKLFGVSKSLVWFFVIAAVFAGLNYWLMHEVKHVVGDGLSKTRQAPAAMAIPAGVYIPVIDPKNDLLAPVAQARSPQMYLKRQLQKNTGERVYGIPKSGGLITQ